VVRLSRIRSASDELSQCIGRLERQGMQCRKPVFRSLHRYLGLEGFSGSEAAEDTALSVPLYPALADDEAAQICLAMRNEWRRE